MRVYKCGPPEPPLVQAPTAASMQAACPDAIPRHSTRLSCVVSLLLLSLRCWHFAFVRSAVLTQTSATADGSRVGRFCTSVDLQRFCRRAGFIRSSGRHRLGRESRVRRPRRWLACLPASRWPYPHIVKLPICTIEIRENRSMAWLGGVHEATWGGAAGGP